MSLPELFIRRVFICALFLLLSSCAISQPAQQNVCITKTGKKYHECNCHYLKYSSFTVSLKEAVERGYTPCSVCRPNSIDTETEEEEPASSGGVQRSSNVRQTQSRDTNAVNTTSQQCTAITKAGTRCKRMTSEANGRCWQHQ
jgi:hypothetical protein